MSIPAAEALPEESVAFGMAIGYASRPITLVAPSPDPEGREIRVVDHLVDATFLWSYAATERLDFALATPFVLHQTGAGADGVTSQSAPPLTRTASRDPRIAAGYSFTLARGLALKPRAEVLLPLGDEHLHAGEAGFVFAPSLAASVERGAFFAGSELGVRLRETVHIATASVGSEIASSLGAGVHILSRERLSFAAEAMLRPSLVEQNRARGDALLVPAEWLASFRSAPFASPDLLLQLAGGGGIPLSQRIESGTTEHYLGVTTPRFRILAVVRYAPAD